MLSLTLNLAKDFSAARFGLFAGWDKCCLPVEAQSIAYTRQIFLTVGLGGIAPSAAFYFKPVRVRIVTDAEVKAHLALNQVNTDGAQRELPVTVNGKLACDERMAQATRDSGGVVVPFESKG